MSRLVQVKGVRRREMERSRGDEAPHSGGLSGEAPWTPHGALVRWRSASRGAVRGPPSDIGLAGGKRHRCPPETTALVVAMFSWSGPFSERAGRAKAVALGLCVVSRVPMRPDMRTLLRVVVKTMLQTKHRRAHAAPCSADLNRLFSCPTPRGHREACVSRAYHSVYGGRAIGLLTIIGCNGTKLMDCGVSQLLLQCFAPPEPVEGETMHAATGSARPEVFWDSRFEIPSAKPEGPDRDIDPND